MGMWSHQVTALALIGLGVVALPACRTRVSGSGRPYPMELTQTETLNIQVVRDSTQIRVTNTTARSIGTSTLWINGSFSRLIEGIEIGETVTLSLKEFRNEYNEQFRAGGFFATERPERLVQAQLETEGRMLGLVVVRPPRQ